VSASCIVSATTSDMNASGALYNGFVLHTRSYRETSALVEILTREHGRVGAVARGVRTRRGANALQPFQQYLLSWRGGRELVYLNSWENVGRAVRLQGTALVSALYLNELIVRLLEREDPHPDVYDAYVQALPGLSDGPTRERTLRIFEMRLIAALGYGMDLQRETDSGKPLDETRRYRFRPEFGIEPAGPNATGDMVVSGRTLLALDTESLDGEVQLLEAKRLMRGVLEHLLNGRRIVARSLLRR
jgi:DNA repair protein RecO (recombination protein O)